MKSKLLVKNLPRLQQQWWVTYQGNSYPLQVYIEPNLPHWKMVIVNNLGQRLLTLDSESQPPVMGDAQHPLRAIYPDLINAAHWSFWPLEYFGLDNHWEIRELTARREIYFSGILQAAFEAQDGVKAGDNNELGGLRGRSHYIAYKHMAYTQIAYTRKNKIAFEIAIESSIAEE